jgi:hypothetical protein
MLELDSLDARLARIESAFSRDGFSVTRRALKGNGFGMLCEHRSARNGATGKPKKAFCLAGDNYHMGWLMGFLAEKDVERMATEFVDNVVFAFCVSDKGPGAGSRGPLESLVNRIIIEAAEHTIGDIPREYIREIDGIVDGCRAANPGTRVKRDRLLALNLGIDCVLAHVYSGRLFAEGGFSPRLLSIPVGCNAFILTGAAAGGRSLFGRDFMFPTAGVFQDTAALVICIPDPLLGRTRHAFVSQTAPGIIGSMTAMNTQGVAMGVNMLPASLCDPERPGFNSLLLTRDCIQQCASADQCLEHVSEARRGVPWLYPVADAAGGAYVIEAGRSLAGGEPFPDLSNVAHRYRRRLPGARYIEEKRSKYGNPAPRNGLIARAGDYRYPEDYIEDWNAKLWAVGARVTVGSIVELVRDSLVLAADVLQGLLGVFRRARRVVAPRASRGAHVPPDSFGERGYINRRWTDKNCPGPFYFAPQREKRPDVLIATNHCISPEMRMASMNEWIALLAGRNQDDIQWRYDELNSEILDALEGEPGGLSAAAAWQLIDFLRPDGRFPEYYNPAGALPWRKVPVHGSVSLCELRGLTMTSRFGYYGDEPVTIHLGNYPLVENGITGTPRD